MIQLLMLSFWHFVINACHINLYTIVQCAVCSVQCAAGRLQCALCSVQCAVCSVPCAVCSVPCAVCSVQCAVCSVQCAVTVLNLHWNCTAVVQSGCTRGSAYHSSSSLWTDSFWQILSSSQTWIFNHHPLGIWTVSLIVEEANYLHEHLIIIKLLFIWLPTSHVWYNQFEAILFICQNNRGLSFLKCYFAI